jgi:1-aminocyclopropane-1-carboxylate deaminase
MLDLPWLAQARVEVAVLRLDLIDPLISGNKWFKLTQHLAAAHRAGAEGVISLGGAHSNHLHALAAAGRRFGFATVGLLRGHAVQTPTTLDLQAWGMQLHWLGYGGYRARHAAGFWQQWRAQYPNFYPVPEGGGGLPGALGCAALLPMVHSQLSTLGWDDHDGWWLAAGTGTTLAGLMLAQAGTHPVYGALAVPDDHGVEENIAAIVSQHSRCRSALARDGDGMTAHVAADVPTSSPASALPRNVPNCRSELARDGDGMTADVAADVPTSSRASALLQNVPNCRSELARDGDGMTADVAADVPASSRASALPRNVPNCRSALARDGDGVSAECAADVPGFSRASAILRDLPAPCSRSQLIAASRGGFGKVDPQLLAFIAESESLCGMPLDPLYTGKALLALHDEVVAGRFAPGTRLIFVHTGGLQGRRAMGLS